MPKIKINLINDPTIAYEKVEVDCYNDQMNLIPLNWDIYLLVKFLIVFILTAIIERLFIKKKIWKNLLKNLMVF